MLKFELNIADRKTLANRMEDSWMEEEDCEEDYYDEAEDF